MSGKANGRKSIFITGAASGIGRATAKFFYEKGWFVGAYDLNLDGLKTLEQEIGFANCISGRLDVVDRENFAAALQDFSEATGGKMDILFNNAGIGMGGLFDEYKFEDLIRIANINFLGVMNGIYAALPLLKATPDSLCFSTSSSAACYGLPGGSVYSATKEAVKGLTEALSIEFSRFGVRAADVLPGFIDTPILGEGTAQYLPKEGMWRAVPPVEIAKAVWASYAIDKERLHWFVPEEISELYARAAADPEGTRKWMATESPFAMLGRAHSQ